MKKTENLEKIRLKLLQLVGSEKITLFTKSYNTELITDEEGEEYYDRVYLGKKVLLYSKEDWQKSHSLNAGKKARIRIKKILAEIETLTQEARVIIREVDEKVSKLPKQEKGFKLPQNKFKKKDPFD